MKGFDIYEAAMRLLGYILPDGRLADDDGLRTRAVAAINQILTDLDIPLSLGMLGDDLPLSNEQRQTCVYGVCMLISIGESDRAKNELFTKIYNGKRSSAKSKNEFIADKMPKGGAI